MGFAVKISEGVFVRSIENGELKLCSQLTDSKVFDSVGAAAKCISGAGVDVNDCSIINKDTWMSDFSSCSSVEESSIFGSAETSRAEKYLITFERLAEICEDGAADWMIKPGDKLEDGYVVVAVKPDTVKIWSVKDNRGRMNWNDARMAASNFHKEWNEGRSLQIEAFGSELLRKEEVERLAAEERATGFYYWASTEWISGYHWFVGSDGNLRYNDDSDGIGCCPALWVGARKSSKCSSKKPNDLITFERLAEILEEESVGIWLRPGAKLENGYIVVAVKPDAVKIWSAKDCIGDMSWKDANSSVGNYVATWNNNNSGLPVVASRSELLSKEEAETMSQEERETGFDYWTATENSSGNHWNVNSDGSLYDYSDSYSNGCCPGIWVKLRESEGKKQNRITFESLHEICKEGSADWLLKPGDKVENSYTIVAVKSDAVKIWSPKDCLGNMDWSSANLNADNYAVTWNSDNSELTVVASRSELLSKEEAKSLSRGDRTTGFPYWASTEFRSGYHCYVDYYGSLYYACDDYSFGCCPGIWVK